MVIGMKSVTLECSAKINLAIDVLGVRPNGYHDVEMIMLSVPLYDTVTVEVGDGEGVSVTCDIPELCGDDNLAVRAAKKFMSAIGESFKVSIDIKKRIPMGAGMAGGSADAAGVLKGLNTLMGSKLSLEELKEIGTSLGADIPFCVQGGCVLAEGIGEMLTDLGEAPDVFYVIAKPTQSVSTKWVYENLDHTQKPKDLCVKAVAEGVRQGDIDMIIKNAGNILENVTIPAYPVVGEYKELMYKNGAMLSLMSGSGSAVFGMFESYDKAATCAGKFSEYTDEVYLVTGR